MKAIAYDENEVESMRVVEFETVSRAREWAAFMNSLGCRYEVIRQDDHRFIEVA